MVVNVELTIAATVPKFSRNFPGSLGSLGGLAATVMTDPSKTLGFLNQPTLWVKPLALVTKIFCPFFVFQLGEQLEYHASSPPPLQQRSAVAPVHRALG